MIMSPPPKKLRAVVVPNRSRSTPVRSASARQKSTVEPLA
jgi:hypothetical protein